MGLRVLAFRRNCSETIRAAYMPMLRQRQNVDQRL